MSKWKEFWPRDLYDFFLWLSCWGIKLAVFGFLLGSTATVFAGTWYMVEAFISLRSNAVSFEQTSVVMLTVAEFYLLALFLFLAAFALHAAVFGPIPHAERAQHLHTGSLPMVERMLLTTVVTIVIILAAKTIISKGYALDTITFIGLVLGLVLAVAVYILLVALAGKKSD